MYIYFHPLLYLERQITLVAHFFRGANSWVGLHSWGLKCGGYFFPPTFPKSPGSLSSLWSFSRWPELAGPANLLLRRSS